MSIVVICSPSTVIANLPFSSHQALCLSFIKFRIQFQFPNLAEEGSASDSDNPQSNSKPMNLKITVLIKVVVVVAIQVAHPLCYMLQRETVAAVMAVAKVSALGFLRRSFSSQPPQLGFSMEARRLPPPSTTTHLKPLLAAVLTPSEQVHLFNYQTHYFPLFCKIRLRNKHKNP